MSIKTLAYGEKNYNYYSAYLREKYHGKRVYKVIVDGGFTCPNRDGSKGYGGKVGQTQLGLAVHTLGIIHKLYIFYVAKVMFISDLCNFLKRKNAF
jgi:radical SAM superfamily enzyme